MIRVIEKHGKKNHVINYKADIFAYNIPRLISGSVGKVRGGLNLNRA